MGSIQAVDDMAAAATNRMKWVVKVRLTGKALWTENGWLKTQWTTEIYTFAFFKCFGVERDWTLLG